MKRIISRAYPANILNEHINRQMSEVLQQKFLADLRTPLSEQLWTRIDTTMIWTEIKETLHGRY